MADRWGPALDDADPPIDLPADGWRWEVANLPHDRWHAWRARAAELTPPGATAAQIEAADWAAYQALSASTLQPAKPARR